MSLFVGLCIDGQHIDAGIGEHGGDVAQQALSVVGLYCYIDFIILCRRHAPFDFDNPLGNGVVSFKNRFFGGGNCCVESPT